MKWLNRFVENRYYWYQIDTKTDEIVRTIFSLREAINIRSKLKNSGYVIILMKKQKR